MTVAGALTILLLDLDLCSKIVLFVFVLPVIIAATTQYFGSTQVWDSEYGDDPPRTIRRMAE